MKNILYFQSGGPTPVINSTTLGVIESFKSSGYQGILYGARFGIEGVLNDDVINLGELDEKQLAYLHQTPGMFLGSSRKKIDLDSDIWNPIKEFIKKYDIGYILVNGGNDSMNTAYVLSQKLKEEGIYVIGVPKTIDNDLPVIDHCPGFASAVILANNVVKSIVADSKSYKKGKVNIIETMGRDTGWIGASTSIIDEPFRPDFIYIPEFEFNFDKFVEEVKHKYSEQGYVNVVIGEGIKFERTELVKADSFGHASLEGVANNICYALSKDYGIPCRSIVLSTISRSSDFLVSQSDYEEAYKVGYYALNAVLQGKTGQMVTITPQNSDRLSFEIGFTDLSLVALKTKFFPKEWLNGVTPSKEFVDYLKPMLKVKTKLEFDNNGTLIFSKIIN